jgi:hypothetical protein
MTTTAQRRLAHTLDPLAGEEDDPGQTAPEGVPLAVVEQDERDIPMTVEEIYRVYHFPGGHEVRIDGVVEVTVRPSGTHRLRAESHDGVPMHHLIPPGWLHLEIMPR